MRTTSRKKRSLLLQYAREGKLLSEVNASLVRNCMDTMDHLEWDLWVNYYEPCARTDAMIERDIISQDRSLAWLARQDHRRINKTILS